MQLNCFKQLHEKGAWKRILSVLMCMVFILGLLPTVPELEETAQAADSSQSIFILHVETGVKSGDDVSYIAVHYYDTDNVQRTEYLLMQGNAQNMSKAALQELTPANTGMDQKQKAMANWQHLKMEISESDKLLKSNSTDDILFTTAYPFQSVIGIDIQMKANGEWTCKAMELYLADTVYGWDFEGYYGKNTYLNYDGKLLCSVETNGAYNYGQTADCIYRIRKNQKESEYNLLFPENSNSDKVSSQYFMKLDIADVGGAGFPALCQSAKSVTSLKNMDLYEELVVCFYYRTMEGVSKSLYVPVISSMVCYLAMECNLSDEQVFGIGQQGTSLFCPLSLPGIDITGGVEVKLIFGNEAANKICGSTKAAENTLDESKLPQITGIQIYEGTTTSASITGYVPTVDTTSLGMPVWYYTASSVEGFRVSAGDGTSIGKLVVTQMVTSPRFEPVDNDTKYLVEITTDDVPNAETEKDLYMTLTYLDANGAECTYGPVNLRSKVEDFYGDWPTDPQGGAYAIGVSSGGVMRFLIQIASLSKFTDITLYMRDGNDDYQFSSIRIYDVQNVSKRSISYSDGAIQAAKASTNWVIDRTVKSRNTLVNYEKATLIQRDSPKKIVFGAASTDMVSEIEVDWEEYRDSMSYEAASNQDLGLTKARVTYEVAVKVHDDKDSNLETGDSGSENMFYFQLVFANGKTSGYVLANQQIQAGRFRSGKLETFNISMGFDYGEISAVRIIPDDTVGEQDTFDKLYVEYVEVTKNGSVSVSPVWRFDINGWIDIDYRDEGAKSSAQGLSGRSEGEISKSYPATSSTYSVNLLCEMAVSEGDANVPYAGALYATVKYKDLNGESIEKTIDVGRAMFVYQGRENAMQEYEASELPIDASTDAGKQLQKLLGSTGTKGVALDTSTMLRNNETSRFLISLTEPKSITSITFYTHTKGYTQAKFSFSISKILSGSGDVYLDRGGSYIRDYGTPTLLTEGVDDSYQLLGHADAALPEDTRKDPTKINVQAIPVLLKDNEIKISSDEYVWTSLLGREPASINDEINVYVYMLEPVSSIGLKQATPITDYDLQLEVNYTKRDATGQMVAGSCTQKVETMNRNTSKNMFYVKGVNVSGLNNVEDLHLWAKKSANGSDITNYTCTATYVVMERVRDGVILDTQYSTASYNVNNPNGSAVVKLSGTDSSGRNSATTQKVMIQISEDSEPFTVTRNEDGYSTDDIIVSLQYHTSNMFSEGETVNSKNAFISDMLSNGQSLEVNPGDVLTFDFAQECLDGISSVTVSAANSEMSVSITGLCVCLYDQKGVCTNCFGKTDNNILRIRQKTQAVTVKENAMVPVTLVITTAEMQNEENTGCRVPLTMKLVYEDGAGSLRERFVNDLRNYIQSGSLESGDTATVTLLLLEFHSMHTATFTIQDTNEKVIESWKPEKILFRAGGSAETEVRDKLCLVAQTIYEGTPYTVNLSDISLAAAVTPGAGTAQITMGNTLELLIKSGESVRFTPYSMETAFVIGSFMDVDVAAYLMVDEASSLCNDYLKLTYLDGTSDGETTITDGAGSEERQTLSEFIFQPEANTTGANQKYRVVIASQEVSTKTITVNVTVLPEPEPEPEPDDEPGDEPNDTPEDEPNDTPEDEPNDTPEDEPNSTPEEEPNSTPEEEPNSTPEEEPNDAPEEEPNSTPEGEPNDTP